MKNKHAIYLLIALLCGGTQLLAQIKDLKMYQKTATGLYYKLHKQNKTGVKAKEGDMVKLHFQLFTEKDSLVRSTFSEPRAIQTALPKPAFRGALEEGLIMMAAGDSASFLVSADSMFRDYGQLPPFLRKGSLIKFNVKMLSVLSEAEYRKKMEEELNALKAIQEAEITDYMAKKGLKATQKLPSGLIYVQTQAGTGNQALPGKKVNVHYTGTLINGDKFDSSKDRNSPFSFQLGGGQVIRGWDEGIALMKEGEKGFLLIPSHLGYGPTGAGQSIPPNAILVFEVELLSVE